MYSMQINRPFKCKKQIKGKPLSTNLHCANPTLHLMNGSSDGAVSSFTWLVTCVCVTSMKTTQKKKVLIE